MRESGADSQGVEERSGGSGRATRLRTTWELLLPIWDIEDRPEAMQHVETVNAMSLDNVFAYKQHYEQQTKKEGKGMEQIQMMEPNKSEWLTIFN